MGLSKEQKLAYDSTLFRPPFKNDMTNIFSFVLSVYLAFRDRSHLV